MLRVHPLVRTHIMQRWVSSCSRMFSTLSDRAALLRSTTPNPKCMRFEPSDGRLSFLKSSGGTVEFHMQNGFLQERENLDRVVIPSLLESLAATQEPCSALVGSSFLSVTLDNSDVDEDRWDDIQDQMEIGLSRDLENWGEDVFSDSETSQIRFDQLSLEEQIEQVLDSHVRPNLQSDGGDIEFRGFKDGIVQLRLVGACRSCPSSTMTLRFGVKALLTRMFQEVKDIEQVFEQGDVVEGKGENWTG